MVITKIEKDLTVMFGILNSLKHESKAIAASYFATDAQTFIEALSTSSDPATVSTKLTKGAFLNGITLSQQIDAFFTNAATTQGDYLSIAYNLINGSAVLNTALSNDVESLGEKMKAMASSLIEREKEIRDILKVYNESELTTAIGSMNAASLIFGTDKTKTLYTDGIVLVNSLRELLTNVNDPQGDFESTISKWIGVY